jgi:magnesium-transporting ATPase (P-type)
MITLLYILFIWMNIYYLTKINTLNERFKNKDLSKLSIIDNFYYLTRVSYWIFLLYSFYYDISSLITILLLLGLLKFILFHINNRIYKIYSLILPIISIIILIGLLLQ